MPERANTPDQKQSQSKPGADMREGQPGMKPDKHDEGRHDQEQGQQQDQKQGQKPGQRAEGRQGEGQPNERKDDRKDQPNR